VATNTGMEHIHFRMRAAYAGGPKLYPQYIVAFNGIWKGFTGTDEGRQAAIDFRDAVERGEVPASSPRSTRLTDPGYRLEGEARETTTRTYTRDPSLAAYRRQELGDRCEWADCEMPESPATLNHVWTDGAHRVAVRDGARMSTWKDYILLCPNHHRIYDHTVAEDVAACA
jgi:predicted HNH restriction endonuclease